MYVFYYIEVLFFFFQAEDGIRDIGVTGVQTCALPISAAGAAFAYYVIFPPAAAYLLGLGKNFRLFLNASDYFDFIIIVMPAMGVVFQMPAITYVLARIGLISASFLVRHWRVSTVVILIAAAVLSPTNDIPNMLLFAAPMLVLYVVSVFVAWIFGRPRTAE